MDTYDILLYGSYILIIVGAAVGILMPLFKSLDNPKGLLKTGVGIVGIALIFFVSYSMASSEVLPKFEAEPFNMTPMLAQVVGGVLFTTYFLAITALVGIVLTEINKAIK